MWGSLLAVRRMTRDLHYPERAMTSESSPAVLSVNVGSPRTVTYRGKPVQTGIWKIPVEGRVPVRGVHVGDDVQADTSVHGGPRKAVYAYAAEDLAWWGARLGRELAPGTLGENLTTEGLDVSGANAG